VIIYALVSGLARRVVEVVRHPIETKIIEEAKPVAPQVPPPAPLPTPKFEVPPPPYIPPPEVRIQQPPPQQTPIVISTPVKPAAPTPPPVARPAEAPPHSSVHTPPVIDASRCEKPEYPPAARRFGETGTVVLRILVGVDGSVISSEVQTSSGSKRLDEAARQGLSLCRFKPGMVDGKPEQAWSTLRYAWKLQD
ncbi:MAG TPA: energy transducer TonB, partial [Burkholderiales bacterium]|nr:energy transducer TonB [Burkholderiales bacterium]